jgi:predicted transcriptional regulator
VEACLDAASLRAIANLELDPRTKQRLDELADKVKEGQSIKHSLMQANFSD